MLEAESLMGQNLEDSSFLPHLAYPWSLGCFANNFVLAASTVDRRPSGMSPSKSSSLRTYFHRLKTNLHHPTHPRADPSRRSACAPDTRLGEISREPLFRLDSDVAYRARDLADSTENEELETLSGIWPIFGPCQLPEEWNPGSQSSPPSYQDAASCYGSSPPDPVTVLSKHAIDSLGIAEAMTSFHQPLTALPSLSLSRDNKYHIAEDEDGVGGAESSPGLGICNTATGASNHVEGLPLRLRISSQAALRCRRNLIFNMPRMRKRKKAGERGGSTAPSVAATVDPATFSTSDVAETATNQTSIVAHHGKPLQIPKEIGYARIRIERLSLHRQFDDECSDDYWDTTSNSAHEDYVQGNTTGESHRGAIASAAPVETDAAQDTTHAGSGSAGSDGRPAQPETQSSTSESSSTSGPFPLAHNREKEDDDGGRRKKRRLSSGTSNSNLLLPKKRLACPYEVFAPQGKYLKREASRNPFGGCDGISRLK